MPSQADGACRNSLSGQAAKGGSLSGLLDLLIEVKSFDKRRNAEQRRGGEGDMINRK